VTTYLGIDPGLDGGIAALFDDGRVLACWPMPTVTDGKRRHVDAHELVRLVGKIRNGGPIGLAVLEQVSAMPKQGVSSTFAFGRSLGVIEGLLAGLLVPYTLVRPQAWQREVLVGIADDTRTKASVFYARRRWPQAPIIPDGCRKPHDGITDALALAEFARRQMMGKDTAA
jgi:hypothetical protein